jgi:hypothetical protein
MEAGSVSAHWLAKVVTAPPPALSAWSRDKERSPLFLVLQTPSKSLGIAHYQG